MYFKTNENGDLEGIVSTHVDDFNLAGSERFLAEIVADVFTKQGSQRDLLDKIVLENVFRHAQTEDNLVVYENEEIWIKTW